jgi:hypothetical protein
MAAPRSASKCISPRGAYLEHRALQAVSPYSGRRIHFQLRECSDYSELRCELSLSSLLPLWVPSEKRC